MRTKLLNPSKTKSWIIGIFVCGLLFSFLMARPSCLYAAPVKKILYVYGTSQTIKEDSENYERMFNTLEGMGMPFDMASFDQLDLPDLTGYQLIIVAWSSDNFWRDPVSPPIEQKIIIPINQGINVLWIGPGIWGNGGLPESFGIDYHDYRRADTVYGIKDAEFTDLSGATVRLAVKTGEFISRISLNGAISEGLFIKNDGSLGTSFHYILSITRQGKNRFHFLRTPGLVEGHRSGRYLCPHRSADQIHSPVNRPGVCGQAFG